jgi:hypothetical protein
MTGVTENDSKSEVRVAVRFLQAGVSEGEIHRRSASVDGRKEMSVWRSKFKDGRTALKGDPEKHAGRPGTSHPDGNCAIVEGSIREDRRVEVRGTRLRQERKAVVHCFTFLGKERYREGMSELRLNAYGDYLEKEALVFVRCIQYFLQYVC